MRENERERKIALYIITLRDRNFVNRCRSARFLGELGSETAVEPLIEALQDEIPHVQWSAAEALGNIGSEMAVEPLIGALKNENWEMRERAVVALGKIGSERAIAPVVEAMDDESLVVGKSAAEALEKIRSKKRVPSLRKPEFKRSEDVGRGTSLSKVAREAFKKIKARHGKKDGK